MNGSRGITLSGSRVNLMEIPRQRKKVIRVTVKKFDVLTVLLEVGYDMRVRGRLLGLFCGFPAS